MTFSGSFCSTFVECGEGGINNVDALKGNCKSKALFTLLRCFLFENHLKINFHLL